MRNLRQHLRDTFLAGVFAGVPIVVTIFIITWVEQTTRILTKPFRNEGIPILGSVLALALIYLIGLAVRSLLGQQILAWADSLLRRLPFIQPIYEAWKQVSFTPGDGGTFSKVVLVPVETGEHRMLGFTSGIGLPGDPDICAVLIPNAPNPISGRLYFVPRGRLTFLNITPEEALKVIISAGNYLPEQLRS